MATVTKTIGMNGLEGFVIKVEARILKGVPTMSIIGLADKAIKESRDRIEACFNTMCMRFPKGRIVFNMLPQDVQKSGGYLDLPMFLSLAMECGEICPDSVSLEETVFFGGISLRGDLESFNGMLPMLIQARQNGIRYAVLPNACMAEAVKVHGIQCFGFDTIHDLVDWFEGRLRHTPRQEDAKLLPVSSNLDFSQVKGQDHLIKFVLAAAAGGHNLLLIGPAGCGKSMIAKRIETILPDMNEDEALEVMAIHSVAGSPRSLEEAMRRPFRSVHYNASANAIIGGGTNAKPGEITLAHNGVLFLDELPEFSRSALEALRQPLEDRVVRVARVKQTNVYPANFMLVAAMNPCPCGNFGSGKCICSPHKVRTYRQRISGPILERMDIQKFMSKVDLFEDANARQSTKKKAGGVAEGATGAYEPSSPYENPSHDLQKGMQTQNPKSPESPENPNASANLKKKVELARAIQAERFKGEDGVWTNAQMDVALIDRYCAIDAASTELIQNAHDASQFSARSYHKILKVARTFADLDGAANIRREDVVSALMSRDLDRIEATPLKGW